MNKYALIPMVISLCVALVLLKQPSCTVSPSGMAVFAVGLNALIALSIRSRRRSLSIVRW